MFEMMLVGACTYRWGPQGLIASVAVCLLIGQFIRSVLI